MAATDADSLKHAKAALLEELRWDIRDRRVLDAIGRVPRERFIPEHLRQYAYENRPLPIGYGQTISQPLIVAMMTEALQLQGGEKTLEIGTGSGYQAAILSQLAREVITVERIAPLAENARAALEALGYDNVKVRVSRDTLGWPEEGPYDAIIVTAAGPEIPRQLLEQLAQGGRLVIPVGGRDLQELVRVTRSPQGARRHNLGPCRFVPLVGEAAWPEVDIS